MDGPQPGDSAPDFSLEGDGGPVTLVGLKGKTVVLYFYPKDDTSGCTAEAKAFSEMAADFALAGAIVVGVSKDTVASHAKFRAKYQLEPVLASDPGGKVVGAYGVWVEKSLYGRKYMGIERATFLIDRLGKVARVWRRVRVAGHVNEVLAAARLLA